MGKDFPEGRARAVLQKQQSGRTVWPKVQLGPFQAAFCFLLPKNKHGGPGPVEKGLPGAAACSVPLVPSVDTIFGQSQLTKPGKGGWVWS